MDKKRIYQRYPDSFKEEAVALITEQGYSVAKAAESLGVRASMGSVGACWDNAVVERFFGSLKHDWILKAAQSTREHMKHDVVNYIRHYNNDRLHTANSSVSPVNYELPEIKVSGQTWPEQFRRCSFARRFCRRKWRYCYYVR